MANLADAYLQIGDAERSLACAVRGYDLTVEGSDRRGQCTAIGNIASSRAALREREEAIRLFEQAIALAQELDDADELAESSWKLGKLLLMQDRARARDLMHIRIAYLETLEHPDLASCRAESEQLLQEQSRAANVQSQARDVVALATYH